LQSVLKSARQKSRRVRFVAGANAHFANRWQISLNRKPANGTKGFTSPAACTLLVHATAATCPLSRACFENRQGEQPSKASTGAIDTCH